MNNLYYLYEIYTNGYKFEVLDVLSLFSILCGILVIVNKNPIVSVLFLIGLFASISSYLIILGLTFIGLSYLIVYVGAVSILFLFILMLINVRISELQSNSSNSIPLATAIGIAFIFLVFQILPYNIVKYNNYSNLNIILFNTSSLHDNVEINTFKEVIHYVTSKMWDGNIIENSHIASVGNIMYTNYNMWLILTSFILLLAMVGAIVITVSPKKA